VDQRRNDPRAQPVGAGARPTRWPAFSRRALAIGVLLFWLAGLGVLARRELLKPMSQRLAEAALEVQPAAAYFALERNGAVVGAAAAEVDTTGHLIIFRQHATGRLVEGDTATTTLNARSFYTRRLAFDSFRVDLVLGEDSLRMSGERVTDSLLQLAIGQTNDRMEPERLVAPDPLFLPVTAAVPLALLDTPRRGRETRVRVFDPWTGTVRLDLLRVAAESLFTVVDSAAFDPRSRRWIMAHRDTVRAWLVTSDSGAFRSWVDRAGRIVEASDGRGLRAVRTAYEIAYENWRLLRDR
jgi:hypothetical protein